MLGSTLWLTQILKDGQTNTENQISIIINKSTASGAIYARSSVIFPHRMAFVKGGGSDAVKRGPKLNLIKKLGKGGG